MQSHHRSTLRYKTAVYRPTVLTGIVSRPGFYQLYASADIATAEMSVRLSARPSHSGIVSKRTDILTDG